MRRKVESSSSEAKIVQIGAEWRMIFLSRPERGTNKLSFLRLGWKVSGSGFEFRLENGSFQTALFSLDFVYRKLRQTLQSPHPTPLQKKFKSTKWQHQHFISLCNFISMQMPFRVLKSTQSTLNGWKCNTTPHDLGGHVPLLKPTLTINIWSIPRIVSLGVFGLELNSFLM